MYMFVDAAVDLFNDGVLNDPMAATNHTTHDLKLASRRTVL